MGNTKHTPGPWHVGMRQAEKIIYTEEGWAVANATVYHGRQDAEECAANARLIAAAPELAEALLGLLADAIGCDLQEGPNAGSVIAARAALAKAGLL